MNQDTIQHNNNIFTKSPFLPFKEHTLKESPTLNLFKKDQTDNIPPIQYVQEVDLFQQNTEADGAKEVKNVKQETENNCPICLESFETLGEAPTFTICNHAFCFKCDSSALAMKPYCPLCRTYQPDQARESDLVSDLFDPPIIPEEDWNLEVVRAYLREQPEGDGSRRVFLSNGEATNIFVGQNAKIQVSPNANLFINGKRVENPQDCNVQ